MRIHGISPAIPFLPALAEGVRVRLAAPEDLARALILLPTRRSARALRQEFLPAGEGAVLLPRMRALAGLSTEDADELSLPALLDLPPPVAPLRRQGVLTSMVLRFPNRGGRQRTPEQAWGLAAELAALLDEIALEEPDMALLRQPAQLAEAWLARLEALVEGELAQHWQITTIFLRGIVREWQGWLEAQELLDVGTSRVLALASQAEAWAREPPPGLVVAAGIGMGGTIPAAAALLRVVAERLPQGFVVLHDEDPATAELLADALDDAATHPFHGQRATLRLMGAAPGPFPPWVASVPSAPRTALLGQALRPAASLPAWQMRRPDAWLPALESLETQTAPDAETEARAIALLLRGALEHAGNAALVTPDRDLARRTAGALARHGIEAEDSAGQDLAQSQAGGFLRLIARMVAEEFAPVATLAVLKHPLCCGGWDRAAWLDAARLLDRALRGPRPAAGLAGLRGTVTEPSCLALLDALAKAMAGLTALPATPALPPGNTLESLLQAAEALAATASLPGGLALYAGEEGEALANHLADMDAGFAALPPIAPRAFPALFEQALAQGVARRPRSHSAHPRVAILGLLEARLLHFDLVVLGGLDESIWPLATDSGPWMGRPMRQRFGLPLPELRIGRVAADFLLVASSAGRAVLSRASRRGGAPTVPARWLTRLATFLRGQTNAAFPKGLALRETQAVAWAAELDRPREPAPPAQRPRPNPPSALRPRVISVSEVAVLLADPYAYYAQRILRLAALEPLEADIGPREYGDVVHGAMKCFVDSLPPRALPPEQAWALWEAASAEALRDGKLRPAEHAFWEPRLARIGGFVIDTEANLRAAMPVTRSHTEVKANLRLSGVTLHARADRVDVLGDGTLRILDYKTGTTPSAKQVDAGTAPQLPLEAMLAMRDGFAAVRGRATELAYWRLSGGVPAGAVVALKEVDQLVEQAEEGFDRLAKTFLLGRRPFIARPDPARVSRGTDYDHLARRAEWEDEN
jgi:ATP-dependent helicase/nuclease subunit B